MERTPDEKEGLEKIKEILRGLSYKQDSGTFWKLIEAASNRYDIEFILRSLEAYHPTVAWHILKPLMIWYLNPGTMEFGRRAESGFKGPEMWDPDRDREEREIWERQRVEFASTLIDVFFRVSLQARPEDMLYPFNPIDDRIVVVEFFGGVADGAKKGNESKIRKWLKRFCQTESLNQLSQFLRNELAKALVLNGCFEECVAYNLFEALPWLKGLTLGKYVERDGLAGFPTPWGLYRKPLESLKENHNPHAWITMLRLMARCGQISFVRTIDPTETAGQPELKQAFVFKVPLAEQ